MATGQGSGRRTAEAVLFSPCGTRARTVTLHCPAHSHATKHVRIDCRAAPPDTPWIERHSARLPAAVPLPPWIDQQRRALTAGSQESDLTAVVFQPQNAIVAEPHDVFAGTFPAPLDARVYCWPLVLALRITTVAAHEQGSEDTNRDVHESLGRPCGGATWIDLNAETCELVLHAWLTSLNVPKADAPSVDDPARPTKRGKSQAAGASSGRRGSSRSHKKSSGAARSTPQDKKSRRRPRRPKAATPVQQDTVTAPDSITASGPGAPRERAICAVDREEPRCDSIAVTDDGSKSQGASETGQTGGRHQIWAVAAAPLLGGGPPRKPSGGHGTTTSSDNNGGRDANGDENTDDSVNGTRPDGRGGVLAVPDDSSDDDSSALGGYDEDECTTPSPVARNHDSTDDGDEEEDDEEGDHSEVATDEEEGADVKDGEHNGREDEVAADDDDDGHDDDITEKAIEDDDDMVDDGDDDDDDDDDELDPLDAFGDEEDDQDDNDDGDGDGADDEDTTDKHGNEDDDVMDEDDGDDAEEGDPNEE